MKRIISSIILLLTITLSCFGLVACNNASKTEYTELTEENLKAYVSLNIDYSEYEIQPISDSAFPPFRYMISFRVDISASPNLPKGIKDIVFQNVIINIYDTLDYSPESHTRFFWQDTITLSLDKNGYASSSIYVYCYSNIENAFPQIKPYDNISSIEGIVFETLN